MRCKPLWMESCLVVCLILLCVESWSESSFEAATLKGIKGVHVLIEDFNKDESPLGLTRKDIQTDVELELRTLGLPVGNSSTGSVGLYVALTFLKTSCGGETTGYAVAIIVALRQPVTVREVFRLLPTWDKSGILITGEYTAENYIRETVIDYVREFANDFLKANPKKNDKDGNKQ